MGNDSKKLLSDIYLVPLGQKGRALREIPQAEVPSTPVSLEKIQDKPCPWLGTPWIHEDGDVCACPNLDVHTAHLHPLKLGNLHEHSFASLSAEAQSSPLIAALQTLGPRAIVENFPLSEWGWDQSLFAGENICDLCHSLLRTPSVTDALVQHLNDSTWQNRMQVLRLLLGTLPPRAALADSMTVQ